jgi:hypothetical protein
MKIYDLVRVAMLFFALCLPAFSQPSSTSGPFKWFHNKHPEKSNPHYQDGMHHRRTSNIRHTGKTKKH